MNKNINPLFLLFSSIIILFITIYSFNNANQQLTIQKKEFEELKILALKYNNLHTIFSDKEHTLNDIKNILKSSNIRNANIIQKNKLITIQMVSLNINQVDKFINKLLNININIKKLELSKNKIILVVSLV